jgi:Tetratricopeptide repeat
MIKASRKKRLQLMMTQAIMAGTGKNMTSRRSRNSKSVCNCLLHSCLYPNFHITAFSFGTINRNTVWKDDITLWSDTVEKSPVSTSDHNNLGNTYKLQGQLEMAVTGFQTALRLKPDYYEARQHISDIVSRQH